MSGAYTYVLPDATYPAPLTGAPLVTFLQGWVAGITGLDGSLVRLAYQGEPPNVPAAGTPWCALTITRKTGDTFPYRMHRPDGHDSVLRHERFDLLASFFDLSITGQADAYAELLRDGVSVDQNRWLLQNNGFGVVGVGDVIAVPSLLKERWNYRADLTISMSREVRRAYVVSDIVQAQGTIAAQDGASEIIELFQTLAGPAPAPFVGLSIQFAAVPTVLIEWLPSAGPDLGLYHVQLSPDAGATWPFDFIVSGSTLSRSVVVTQAGSYQARVAAVATDTFVQSAWSYSGQIVVDMATYDPLLNPDDAEITAPNGAVVFVRQ